jgi:hypothetical protein
VVKKDDGRRLMMYFRTLGRVLLIFVLLSIFVSCESEKKAEKGEELEGWVSLFNGKDLNDWKIKIAGHELNDNYKNTYRVENGLLKVSYEEYEQFDDKFGLIFYKDKFSNYLLRVEYRFVGEQVPGAPDWAFKNSGIMVHCNPPESMTKDQKFPVCIEAQLLGGNGKDERHTGNVVCLGTKVVMAGETTPKDYGEVTSKTIHDDRWVTMELEVLGNKVIKFMLDGQLIAEFNNPQLNEENEDAQKLIKDGEKMLHEGYIALQAESHPVEFRKIEILDLNK